MPATGILSQDDKWYWKDDLWLYIRDYDIEVPEEFITHVKKFFEDGGTVHPAPYQGHKIPGYDDGREDEFSRRPVN